jgi:hypothetical protein
MHTHTLYETELTKLEDDDNAPSVVSISYDGCAEEEDEEDVSSSIEICNMVCDLTLYLSLLCTVSYSFSFLLTKTFNFFISLSVFLL